jgi:putative transcriptional regulator
MAASNRHAPLFERLKAGLEEGIRHAHGEIKLRTTVLPDRPPDVSPSELAALRNENHLSQAVFASVLNVSLKTVQSWEQGSRKPSQAALRLIQVVRENPALVFQAVGLPANGEVAFPRKSAKPRDGKPS